MERINFRSMQTKTCFDSLENKSFAIIPECLLNELTKKLTATAKTIYLHIYAQAKKEYMCKKKLVPVKISAKALAENHIYKSVRTIRRRLAELQEQGFIIIENTFTNKNNRQSANNIYPILPSEVVFKLKKEKNRATRTRKAKINTDVIHAECNLDGSIVQRQSILTKDYINNSIKLGDLASSRPEFQSLSDMSTNHLKSPANNELDFQNTDLKSRAYEDYIEVSNKLQEQGLNKLQAYKQAYKNLSDEFKCLVNDFLEAEKKALVEKEVKFIKASRKKVGLTCVNSDKNGVHKIYNNFVNNNKQYEGLGSCQQDFPLDSVNLKNISKKISFDFIRLEILKLFKNNLISSLVYKNGKTIHDLILEIYHHVKLRNIIKTTSELHALNAAKAMLKNGTWATPKKYAFLMNQEAIKRELQAYHEKQEEARCAKLLFAALG